MESRRFSFGGVVTAVATATLLVLPGGAHSAKSAPPPTKAQAVKADRDRDGVFDDLEKRLTREASGSRLGVLVMLDGPATAERVRRLERAVGAMRVTRRFAVVDAFAATVTKGQVRSLARQGMVAHVEEDSPVQAFNSTAQSSFGVTQVRVDTALFANPLDGGDGIATYSSSDLVAAVIDTGIDPLHQDLDGGKVLAFQDFVNGRAEAYDDHGHGTHVAGTIAGAGDTGPDGAGVAPGAALVGIKVLDSRGSGTMSNVTAGIDWAVRNRAIYGIEALNLSLGTTSGCSDGTDTTSVAVNNAHASGLVVAVAAGNSGSGTCTIGSPGAADDAVTVGAMADLGSNGFYQDYLSSRGRTADGDLKPDVSAPGVSITSARANSSDGYAVYSGTSMAAPFVAGVALLMRDQTPSLTSASVKQKLMQTAVDWGRGGDNRTAGTTGVDIDYGAGRLDAYAAVQSAGATISSPPATPGHELLEGSLPGTGASVDYEFGVADTSFPIAATLIHAGVSGGTATSPDFDLYLLGPDGAELDRGYTIRRQEDVRHSPSVVGTYTIRVKSYSGSGTYFLDVSLPASAPNDVPPETTITEATTSGGTARFSFASSEPSSSFECRLDIGTATGAWAGCTSPKEYSGLSQGAYAFHVRARDAAGNIDATPASHSWTISSGDDTTPPDTSISSATTTGDRATFAFSSNETGSSFECRLDAGTTVGDWTACTSPKEYSGLSSGSYTFYVRAIDAASNVDDTPATHAWTVAPTAGSGTLWMVLDVMGTHLSGDESSLLHDDADYYVTGAAKSESTWITKWHAHFLEVPNSPESITVTYRGRNTRSCQQQISIHDFTTFGWVLLDSRDVKNETTIVASPSAPLERFVSDGMASVQVVCRRDRQQFESHANRVSLSFTR